MQRIKNIYHLICAILANVYFGFPAHKITVIGVTGTDGKTTTTSLIYHILKSSGKKTAMISTIGAYINNKVYDVGFHVTTPSPFALQRFIKKIVDGGNEYLVLEVTSHSLDQNRIWGIPFEIGVLTNVTHEHLDYHKTYENYLKTKFKLLRMSQKAIVNMDDESYEYVTKDLRSLCSLDPSRTFRMTQGDIRSLRSLDSSSDSGRTQNDRFKKIITYSLLHKDANITMKKFPFKSNLIGEFNIYNCLAAITAAKQCTVPDSVIRKDLKTYTPPIGRQAVVYDKDFRVIIDFAHTPNAFEKILPAVKPKKGRLIHVFGSAGLRDASKRPLMGKASSTYADIIILTAEDPRTEKVEEINREIIKGIPSSFPRRRESIKLSKWIPDQVGDDKLFSDDKKYKKILFQIPDRTSAIKYAISLAQKGDTVIITGKAHEKSMNLGRGEEPWDEFAVVKRAIDDRMKQ